LVMLGRASSHKCSCASFMDKLLARYNKNPFDYKLAWVFLLNIHTVSNNISSLIVWFSLAAVKQPFMKLKYNSITIKLF